MLGEPGVRLQVGSSMDLEKLSFSDGEVESIGFENPNFVVLFRQWNAEPYKLVFKEFVYLECFEIGTDTNDTVILSNSEEIENVKNRILSDGGTPESYNYFKFKQVNFSSSDGVIYLKVISPEIEVVAR